MKKVEFIGGSLKALRGFPLTVKRELGHQLDRVQRGYDPIDWKAMSSIGSGVHEIRIKVGGEFRVIYIAKLKNTVYVLHAFQKKTQKTRTQHIETAMSALKKAYERNQR